MGLQLDQRDLDTLLDSVTGDDLLRMNVVLENCKLLTSQLAQLTKDSGEDMEIAQKYYGMYVILLTAIHYLHVSFLRRIETKYIPQLDAYVTEAHRNISDAQSQINSPRISPENNQILQQNIEANLLTLKVASMYLQTLHEQKTMILKRKQTLDDSIRASINTLKNGQIIKKRFLINSFCNSKFRLPS